MKYLQNNQEHVFFSWKTRVTDRKVACLAYIVLTARQKDLALVRNKRDLGYERGLVHICVTVN